MNWRPGLWLLQVLSLALLGFAGVGCTEPNPRSCADGTCTDPSLPFCDVDGALAGTPNTCIAVSCTPGEHAVCRGDTAVRCNATGNDYELVQCQGGCSDAHGGCTGCSADEQCANPAPICDPGANSCRGCQSDDECPSTACDLDTGACVASSAVVYAAPEGATSGQCTQAAPCELRRAGDVAAGSGLGKILRLLPGTYTSPLVIEQATSLQVVASGAELGATSGLRVSGGATVAIRDLVINVVATESTEDFRCGSSQTSSPRTSLTLVNVRIGRRKVLSTYSCNLRIERSLVESGIFLNKGSSFEGDRVLYPSPAIGLLASHAGVSARVTNSVFYDAHVGFGSGETDPAGLSFHVAFNTFIYTDEDGLVSCNSMSSVARDVRFENNIVYATRATNAVFRTTQCTFSNNVLYPQANPIVGNIVADPQFVDFENGDYRLKAGSPAIDAAVPSTGLSTLHDFDGTTRPQGAGHDIGAFEHVP